MRKQWNIYKMKNVWTDVYGPSFVSFYHTSTKTIIHYLHKQLGFTAKTIDTKIENSDQIRVCK